MPKHISQDPTLPQGFNSTFRERFWPKVKKTDTCWLWTASKFRNGYGKIKQRSYVYISAHRASWIMTNGDFDKSLCVLHHCDNPSCVNPDHLFLGDKARNSEDMCEKNRQRSGEYVTNHKLTWKDVSEIRTRRSEFDEPQQSLAHDFHVSVATISNIINMKVWRS